MQFRCDETVNARWLEITFLRGVLSAMVTLELGRWFSSRMIRGIIEFSHVTVKKIGMPALWLCSTRDETWNGWTRRFSGNVSRETAAVADRFFLMCGRTIRKKVCTSSVSMCGLHSGESIDNASIYQFLSYVPRISPPSYSQESFRNRRAMHVAHSRSIKYTMKKKTREQKATLLCRWSLLDITPIRIPTQEIDGFPFLLLPDNSSAISVSLSEFRALCHGNIGLELSRRTSIETPVSVPTATVAAYTCLLLSPRTSWPVGIESRVAASAGCY